MTDSIVKNKLSKPIDSLNIDKEDLRKLLGILQERANSACDIECKFFEETFVKVDNLQKSIQDLKSCSTLKLTIVGIDGKELFGNIDDVFNSVSFPDKINTLYVNSGLIYKSQFNYIPRNQFEVLLDFNKPKVFDFSFQPSGETPNNSMFCVEGFDNTWVNGVFSEIDKFFEKYSSRFSKIHRNSIYDVLVWTLGVPIAFWICFKFNSYIDQVIKSSFLQNALYIYIFFFTLFLLRILFHYSRWLYPKIHFRTKRDLSLVHQGFFYVITTGVLGAFLYDVICWFLK
jgi:hypothetical protein